METVADQGPHPRDAGIDRARSDEYARAAMDRWSTRIEPLQPGRSGTDGRSGVSFTTPDTESARRMSTQEGRDDMRTEKLQGPSGLIEASSDTAAASRQNAEELTADDDMAFIGTICQDEDLMSMMMNLGTQSKSHKREGRAARRRMVSEIYSQPRVTRAISSMPSLRLVPGFALDLTCIDPDDGMPWDFDIESKQIKALE